MVSCVDTCFAMEPARALRLKGYAVMFGSAVQYTSNIGMLYGFVTRDITTSGLGVTSERSDGPSRIYFQPPLLRLIFK